MPVSNSEPTDGNTAQWDKVKAMRDRRDAADRGESTGTPVQVVGLEPPKPPVEPPPAAAAPPPADPPRQEPARDPATGQFTRASDGTPAPAAEPHQEAPKTVAPAPDTAPTMRMVKIDGVDVPLPPELADAFEKSEKITKEAAAVVERNKLKDELREELRAELAPPPKTEAELAAERALAEAERLKLAPKKPDATLNISDPVEYEKQRDAYEEWRMNEAIRKTKEETLAAVRTRDTQQAQLTEKQAREILREQFFAAFPSLKPSSDLADGMLKDHFDGLIASGKLQRAAQLPAAEREALKQAEFATVAAGVTRRLAKLMHAGKTVIPPAPPPPALVSSAPARSNTPPKATEPPAKPKSKYPEGSMSAALAARKAQLSGNAA